MFEADEYNEIHPEVDAEVSGSRNAKKKQVTWGRSRVWKKIMNTPIYPLLLVILALVFWQYVVAKGLIPGIPTKYIGSPSGIWDAFVSLVRNGYQGSSLWTEVSASLIRVFLGYAIGVCIAIPLGLWMGTYDPIGKLLGPIFGFLRPIPALAFIPAVIIWFGIGQTGRLVVIAVTSFLYAEIGVVAGVHAVPNAYHRVVANYQLSRPRAMLTVILPAALPDIFVGLRTAMALAWAVVIAAELIAAQHGLGYMIENASTFFEINIVYVGIAIIGIVGVLMEIIFSMASKKVLHWQGR